MSGLKRIAGIVLVIIGFIFIFAPIIDILIKISIARIGCIGFIPCLFIWYGLLVLLFIYTFVILIGAIIMCIGVDLLD